MADLKIGDEVYIHGFVDEVRRDTVIIRNEGGYFGTVTEEIMPSAQPEHIHCKECRWFEPDRHQCGRQICAVFYEDDYCSFAERKTDD